MKKTVILLRRLAYTCLRARVVLAFSIVLYLFLFTTNGVPYVYSDGYYYYHTARTIIDDGTFASDKEPEFYDHRGHAIIYYQGKYVEASSPGGALFLVPGLAVAKLFRLPEQTTYTDYFMAFNGHTLVDGFAVLLTATVFTFWAGILIYRSLRLLRFGERVSSLSTVLVYASSYAIWYALLASAFTHTYELFCAALVLWSLIKLKLNFQDKYLVPLIIGLGLLFLLRPIFAVLAIFIGLYLLYKRKWAAIIKLILMGLPFLAIWLGYNYISYGSWIASGYSIVGSDFTLDFNAHNVLFSPQRGWFIYSPLCLLGTIGLMLWWKKERWLASFSLAAIISIALIYGFWPAWWGGGTFGQRFLILLIPFCALGVAWLLTSLKGKTRLLVTLAMIVLTSWSVLITVLYRFTPVGGLRPVTDVVGDMYSGDRYTPFDMLSYHFDLLRDATTLPGYLKSVYKSANGGISIAAILLGASDFVIRVDDRISEELCLKFLAPPISSQERPQNLYFYQVMPDNTVYRVDIQLTDTETDFVLDCTSICTSVDPRIDIALSTEHEKLLSRKQYVAMYPEFTLGQFLFYRPENMQIKGPVWELGIAEEYFTLP